MTIIFEQRQVNDKVLVVQFHFDTHDIKVNGSQVDGLSFDKYIGLDVWTQIYTKLEEPLQRYKKSIETRLKDEIIPMRRAQLELRVSWRSKQAFHREIVKLESSKKCDLCPFSMVVKIGMVSVMEKYKKQHSQDKMAIEKSQQKSIVRETNESNGQRTSNGSSSCADVEEYVPSGSGENSLKYTPSTVSSSNNEKSIKSEEYSPDLFGDVDAITYTPTKIDEKKVIKDQSNRHKSTTIKTDLNRNDYHTKKKRTEAPKINELFGGDSDDSSGRLNHILRSAKKTNHTDSSKNKPQPKIDHWITTRTLKKNPHSVENDAPDETQRKRKLNEISFTGKKPIPKLTEKDEEAKKMRALRMELEEMEKQDKIDCFINLKDMTSDQILETLPKYESTLRKIFQKFAKIPDKKAEPTKAECDFLLILDSLLESEQQTKMYVTLREVFCQVDISEPSSNHENLFWMRLVPEWALLIFMDRHYFFTKEEAIERLQQQEQAKINSENSEFSFD